MNLTLSGFWSETKLTYLELLVNLCSPSDTQEKCMENRNNLDKARRLNRNVFLTFYFQNNILNTKNYTNFTVPFSDVLVFRLDPDFFKFAQVFIRKQTLETDDGNFLENESRKEIFSLDYYYSDVTMRTGNLLYAVDLHPSSKSYEERRVYKKIQSALADVGAIFDYLRFSASLICVIFASTKKNLKIINKLFEFDWENEKNRKTRKISSIHRNILNKDNQLGEKYNINDNKPDNPFSPSPLRNIRIVGSNEINNKDIKVDVMKNKSNENVSDSNINFIEAKISRSNRTNLEGHQFLRNSDDKSIISKGNSMELSNIHKKDDNENNKKGKEESDKFTPKQDKINKRFNFMKIRRKTQKKKRINFSFIETMKTNLCCCLITKQRLKNKLKLYDEGIKKMDKMLDICYLMNKLEELEKMKFVFFNKKQLTMFNLLSKDVCSLNSNKKSLNIFNKMKKFESDKVEIEKVLRETKEKSLNKTLDLNEMDKRLFNMLSADIREYLKINHFYNIE